MQKYFDHFFESPRKPGTRIFVQTEEEAEYARDLIGSIARRWPTPSHFYHLRKGGHLLALRQHTSDRYFARRDLRAFFSSITRNKVCRALKKVGFSFADATTIAHRSCVFAEGRRFLPYGYVQSPLLASIVLDKSALGHRLDNIRRTDVNVSVFMDDITLSHRDSTEPLHSALDDLAAAAQESHFDFSQERDKAQDPAEMVTAFNIELSRETLRIQNQRFEEFAGQVLVHGLDQTTAGILGYVRQVNRDQYSDLQSRVI